MTHHLTAVKAYYQEHESFFSMDGVIYVLNGIWRDVHVQPILHIPVEELCWVCEFADAPDEARIEASDITTPLLVTEYRDKQLAVDGQHRLIKAMREGTTTLPYRRVSPKVMADNVLFLY